MKLEFQPRIFLPLLGYCLFLDSKANIFRIISYSRESVLLTCYLLFVGREHYFRRLLSLGTASILLYVISMFSIIFYWFINWCFISFRLFLTPLVHTRSDWLLTLHK